MTRFPLIYEEPIFRPPSEAQSVLLPVTIGCSHNKCTYCAMYQSKKYRVRPFGEIMGDLQALHDFCKRTGHMPRRFFFCDGDAMSAPTPLLVQTAAQVLELFRPSFERISLYANVAGILGKSADELREISAHEIHLAYIGMESGWDSLLTMTHKGHDAASLIAACRALRQAGIKVSLIVMIGLAGADGSMQHAMATARVLSEIAPDYLSFLLTTPIPGTTYQRQWAKGAIKPMTTRAIFAEMMTILKELVLPAEAKITFRANHVSNLMPLRGELPRETGALTTVLREWMEETPADVYPRLDPTFL